MSKVRLEVIFRSTLPKSNQDRRTIMTTMNDCNEMIVRTRSWIIGRLAQGTGRLCETRSGVGRPHVGHCTVL